MWSGRVVSAGRGERGCCVLESHRCSGSRFVYSINFSQWNKASNIHSFWVWKWIISGSRLIIHIHRIIICFVFVWRAERWLDNCHTDVIIKYKISILCCCSMCHSHVLVAWFSCSVLSQYLMCWNSQVFTWNVIRLRDKSTPWHSTMCREQKKY